MPAMIEKRRGHVLNIVSLAAFAGFNMLSDYAGSKGAAFCADESLRHELHKNGHSSYIKTTCFCPYFINTGMFDGAKSTFPFKFLEPEDVADRAIYAVQQEESLVTMPYSAGWMCSIMRLLPQSIADPVGRWCGLQDAMGDFEGRGNINTRL